jgi:hypothetical protein
VDADKEDDAKDQPTMDKVYTAMDRQRRHLEQENATLRKSLKGLEQRRKFESDKGVQRNTLFLSYDTHPTYLYPIELRLIMIWQ